MSDHVETTIIVAQIRAGINGRRIQKHPAIRPKMKSTAKMVRAMSCRTVTGKGL